MVIQGGTNAVPNNSNADFAIQINGRDPVTYDVTHPIGNVVFDDVTVVGSYAKTSIYVQGYTDLNGLQFQNNGFGGATVFSSDGWGIGMLLDPMAGESPTATAGTPGEPGFFDAAHAVPETVDLRNVMVSNDTVNPAAGIPLDVVFNGTTADDTFIAGMGTATTFYEGGGGFDTLVYANPITVEDFTTDGTNWIVSCNSGTDILNGVERVNTDAFLLVGSGGFATIQDAVNHAHAGDTILIAAGTYTENVNVTVNDLTIENAVGDQVTIVGTGGFGGAITVAAGVTGTTIQSSDDTPSNFVLQGAPTGQLAALYLAGGNDNTTIDDITATASDIGAGGGHNAVLTGGNLHNVTFEDSVFSGNAAQLVYVNGAESLGAGNQNSDINFVNNTFSGTAGLLLGLEGTGSVTGNTFSGTSDVELGLAEPGVTVTGNTFAGSTTAPDHLYVSGDGSYDPQSIVDANTFPNGEIIIQGKDGVYATIQAAVDHAADGDTILVGPGTYTEQVVINGRHNLTIEGVGSVSVDAPSSLSQTGTSPSNGRSVDGIFTVVGGSGITIKSMTVDGLQNGGNFAGTQTNPTMVGVAYLNSTGGTIDGLTVQGIREGDAGFGVQRNIAIYVSNTDPSPGTNTPSATDLLNSITISNNTVSDFQKGGIVVTNGDVNIHDNTVTGRGTTGLTAQNGIQVSNSTGSVVDNTVSGIGYTDPNVALATGILTFDNNGLSVTGNTVTVSGASEGIDVSESTNGTVTGNTVDGALFGIVGESNDIFGESIGGSFTVKDNAVTNVQSGGNGVFFDPTPSTSTSAMDIEGSSSADVLAGAGGGDTFEGFGGDDLITGNGGTDTAVYTETLTLGDFSFDTANNQWVVTTATEGTDDLKGIEIVTDGAGHRFLLVGGGSQFAVPNDAAGTFRAGDIIVDTPAQDGVPTLTIGDTMINAAEAGHVSFTVAGLDIDASGIATFMDHLGHTKTATVNASGTFSVDLSGLADGSITSSLSVTDTAQNSQTVTGTTVSLDQDLVSDVSVAITGGLTGTGHPVEGQMLTATVTDDDGDLPASGIVYTWQVNHGSGFVTVHTATDDNTYTPVDADENAPLRVQVSYTDTFGNLETATSGFTNTVVDVAPTLSVAIIGTPREGQHAHRRADHRQRRRRRDDRLSVAAFRRRLLRARPCHQYRQ